MIEGAARLRVRAHYNYHPADTSDSPLLASTRARSPLPLLFHPDGLDVHLDGRFVVPGRSWASRWSVSARVEALPHGERETLAPGASRVVATVQIVPDSTERLVRTRARWSMRDPKGPVVRMLVSPWVDVELLGWWRGHGTKPSDGNGRSRSTS